MKLLPEAPDLVNFLANPVLYSFDKNCLYCIERKSTYCPILRVNINDRDLELCAEFKEDLK